MGWPRDRYKSKGGTCLRKTEVHGPTRRTQEKVRVQGWRKQQKEGVCVLEKMRKGKRNFKVHCFFLSQNVFNSPEKNIFFLVLRAVNLIFPITTLRILWNKPPFLE